MTLASTPTRWTFLLALALGLAGAAPAQAREEGAPAAALGMGDAVRASPTGAAALYFNPAGMSLLRTYSVEAGYSYTREEPGHSFGATAIDSRTNGALAMGLSYTFINAQESGGDRDGHRIRGGLATGHSWDGFGLRVGFGVHYLKLDKEVVSGTTDGGKVNFFTVDAGLILELARIMRIGVVGQNLIDTKSTREGPRLVGLGAAFILNSFEVSFDTDLDLQSRPDEVVPSYAVGLQGLFGGSVITRTGFRMDGLTEAKRAFGGVGYISQALAGDVSFSKRVDQSGGWELSLALRYFLP